MGFGVGVSHWKQTVWISLSDKPYIRLLPQLSPKLAHQGLSVEVNEGEDLELSVLIEAYPHIIEHRWHTPTSPNTSTQEHKFIRYNNRYKKPEKSGPWMSAQFFKNNCPSVLQEGEAILDLKHAVGALLVKNWRGTPRSFISSGHETTARGKSGVLFLNCWRAQRWYIGSVCIKNAELVTSGPVDIPLFLLGLFILDTMQVCSWREWTHRSRGSTPSLPGVTWPMRPSRSKCKCIVSDLVKKSNECD